MPLSEKLGRPFELLSLISRKRKDGQNELNQPFRGPEARAYANATGLATTGYTNNYRHPSHSSSSSSGSYSNVKYEHSTPVAPVVKYERLTPGAVVASANDLLSGPALTLSSPGDCETAARDVAFPSLESAPSAACSFHSAPSPALSSLPSPGMLTPLTVLISAPSTSIGPGPVADTTRPPRHALNLVSPTEPPLGPAGAPSAPFSSVMEEWMSQLRTPTPDVTLLPSPYDFHKDTPAPMDTNSMDMRRLQDSLLPTPPPDCHDQRQNPKTSAYVTTRGPRPMLEDIASLCRDLNAHGGANPTMKGLLGPLAGQIDNKYIPIPARPLREESLCSVYSDDGESHAKVLAAAVALSSVSSIGIVPAITSASSMRRGKRRKMCTAKGCQNLSRSRGLCKAHGGGRRCSVEGCSRASQSGSLCITHGGGKRCTIEGCVKAAQSRGMCKAHGGGVRCRVEGCTKSSQGDGFCRSHGGGRRCGHLSGCSKWAQRNGMCMAHSEGKYGNSYRGRQHRSWAQTNVQQT